MADSSATYARYRKAARVLDDLHSAIVRAHEHVGTGWRYADTVRYSGGFYRIETDGHCTPTITAVSEA